MVDEGLGGPLGSPVGGGWDPVPPREEPGEQDAGDLKGPPNNISHQRESKEPVFPESTNYREDSADKFLLSPMSSGLSWTYLLCIGVCIGLCIRLCGLFGLAGCLQPNGLFGLFMLVQPYGLFGLFGFIGLLGFSGLFGYIGLPMLCRQAQLLPLLSREERLLLLPNIRRIIDQSILKKTSTNINTISPTTTAKKTNRKVGIWGNRFWI